MADIKVTGEANFTSVTTGMQKIGKDADNLKRKVDRMGGGKSGSQRGGMGILEISRGVEDFAVAGMRGLLNNIPGIIMSLGGGMGLAGVVSLAAVGVTLFGKKLMDLANPTKKSAEDIKALKEQTDKYTEALERSREKLEKVRASEEAANRAIAAKAANTEMLRRLGDPVGLAERKSKEEKAGREARDRLYALKAERDLLLGFPGATPKAPEILDFKNDEEAAQNLVDRLKARNDAIAQLQAEVSTKGGADAMASKIRDLEGALAFAEKNMAGFTYESEKASKTLKDTMPYLADMISQLGRLEAADKNDPLSPLVLTDGAIESAKAMRTNSAKQIAIEKEKIKELKKQLAIIGEQNGEKQATLDLLDKELVTNSEALKSAMEAANVAKQTRQQKEEELKIQEEINKLQIGKSGVRGVPIIGDIFDEMTRTKSTINQSKELADAFKSIDTIISSMRINGGDLLSSKGRIGGSATEFNSAIATINYQRESLKELRTIARNTAKNRVATYQ